nr:Protein of unknown function DUF1650 domain containing protein [Haemonchus contortus]
MKLSSSSPHLSDSPKDKIIFPDSYQIRNGANTERYGDVGSEKDKLDVRESCEGYWTPRETMKRGKDAAVAPCGDSVSTDRFDMEETTRRKSSGPRTRFVPRTTTKGSDKDWKDLEFDYLDCAKLELKRMSEDMKRTPLTSNARVTGASLNSLTDVPRVQFSLSQTPPLAPLQHSFSPILQSFPKEHRGELDMSEKYNYDLSKAQLKASSRTSALLAGFAMVALVELQYDQNTPHWLLILLGVVTTLLVSVHLLALMMSTCILPYMEATGCTQDSPHIRLKFYIDLSWLFSTCIGLLLFLVEIGIIFFVKFTSVDYQIAGYITTAMLVPVVVVFVIFSYLIHKSRVSHTLGRFKDKVDTMKHFLDVEAQIPKPSLGGVKDI